MESVHEGPLTHSYRGLRPESELVLVSAKTLGDHERSRQIRTILNRGIEWDYLIRIGSHHGILPLLFWRLKEVSQSVPSKTFDYLRSCYDRTCLKNLRFLQELLRILDLLEAEDIPAIPLKGAALLTSACNNAAFRPMYDLDVLVKKGDIPRLRELMDRIGYVPEVVMNASQVLDLVNSDSTWEYNFRSESQMVNLEFHWTILPDRLSSHYDSSCLWQNIEYVSVAGRTIRSIEVEELILLLCIHGGEKHQWWCLKWIWDVAQVIEKTPGIDWDRVLHRAQETQRENVVILGLYLATALLGTVLPDMILHRMERFPLLAGYAGLIRGRLFRDDFGVPGFREWFRYVTAAKSACGDENSRKPSLDDFLSYLRIVTTPEWADKNVSKCFRWIAYCYRPIRLLRKHRTALLPRLQ
jgi:putative nucleotidyltransferase-like protein